MNLDLVTGNEDTAVLSLMDWGGALVLVIISSSSGDVP